MGEMAQVRLLLARLAAILLLPTPAKLFFSLAVVVTVTLVLTTQTGQEAEVAELEQSGAILMTQPAVAVGIPLFRVPLKVIL